MTFLDVVISNAIDKLKYYRGDTVDNIEGERVYFNLNAEQIDDLNYLDHLGFFVAMALDTQSWSPETLSRELGLSRETLLNLQEAYGYMEEPIIEDMNYTTDICTAVAVARDLRKNGW